MPPEISEPALLGCLEELAILAVAAGGEPHAPEVRARLAGVGRAVTPGALYTTLQRLERKGLLTSHLGAPRARVRPRRYYRVAEEGWAAVAAAQRQRAALWAALPAGRAPGAG